jgi:hypothetical protein
LPPNTGGCRSIQANKAGDHKQAQWRTEVCYTVGLSNDDEDKANALLIAEAPAMRQSLGDVADAANDLWALLNHNPDKVPYGDEYDKEIHRLNYSLGKALQEHGEAIRKAKEE